MVGFPMWHFLAKWRDPSVIYVLWQFESATATRGHVQSIQINPSQIAIDIRPSAWLVVQSLFTLQTCDWHWQCEKKPCHPLPPNAGKVPGAQKSARAVCDGQIPSPNHIQLHFHSPKRNSGFVLDHIGSIFFIGDHIFWLFQIRGTAPIKLVLDHGDTSCIFLTFSLDFSDRMLA
jgi:hypothetical protein